MYLGSELQSLFAFSKVKPKMAEIEGAIRLNPSPLRGPKAANSPAIAGKTSKLHISTIIFDLNCINVTVTTFTVQKIKLTSYSSFKFRHLWLHFLDPNSHSRYMIDLTEL